MTTVVPAPGAPRAPALRMTRARIITLAIGVPLALLLIGWTGFSLVAQLGQASFPVSYSVPVHGGQVTADISGGDLTLRQVPGSAAARLTGTARYSLVRPDLTRAVTAAGTVLAYHCRIQVGNCQMNATLDVPGRTAVSLSSGGGDLSVSDFAGTLTVSSGGGNLTASNLAGDLLLSTSGGDVNACGLAGQVQLSTGGGNVSGQGVTAPHVTVQSDGGDISLTFTQVPSDLQISAGGGNVTVILPSGAAKYRITASAGGGNTNIGSSVPVSSSSGHTITVDSGGGDISISEPS